MGIFEFCFKVLLVRDEDQRLSFGIKNGDEEVWEDQGGGFNLDWK